MTGDNCSASCRTRDHESWGECVRAKEVNQMWLGGTGPSLGDQRRFDRENQNFRNAVRDGLNPAGVSNRAVNAAYDAASKG